MKLAIIACLVLIALAILGQSRSANAYEVTKVEDTSCTLIQLRTSCVLACKVYQGIGMTQVNAVDCNIK